MNFDLPPTGTEQPPVFTDLAQCRDWQAKLPMSSPIQAQAQMLRQLHLLNRYSLTGAVRLAMLESIREPLYFVQGESAKKFSGKPLPLAPPEQAALDTTHGLWQALASGYVRCLEACRDDADMAGQAALVCQRALATLTDDQVDLVRAGLLPVAEHWRLTHRVYAATETLGVATVAVADGLRTDKPQAPQAAYAEQMLLAAASLHELPPRQQGWVMRWARRWASKLVVLAEAPAISRALPLCVDLAGDQPVGFKPHAGPGARFLDTTELRKSVKGRIELLAAGGEENTPAKLGLGDDCLQPACEQVLRRLYPRWIKGGVTRRHDRQPTPGACRFVVGVDAIHYYIAGHQPFKPPGQATTEELRRQREELATFGRIAERFEDEYSRNHGYQLENWEVDENWTLLDQSSGGLRLVRPLKQTGGRLAVGQLVAVQPPGGSGSLVLGVVRWAQIRDEQLATGIQLFPGKPWPVAVRGTGVMAGRDPYKPGFMLPAVAALGQPDSIVLPPGSFKPERIMEVWSAEGSINVKLKEALDRSVDFERVSCVEVERKP